VLRSPDKIAVKTLEQSLRGVILLSALIVLLSVSLVYGIRLEFAPKTNPQASSTPIAYGVNGGFQLTLTLQKTEYALGEPVNVTLTVTNISNQTVQFYDFASYWDFVVYNDTDYGLYEWLGSGRASPLGGTTYTLDRGMGIANEDLVWPQTCNSTVSLYGVPESPVLPGTYYIVGEYGNLGNAFYKLQTTPIQITIVQP
jgi:hypothetical protein